MTKIEEYLCADCGEYFDESVDADNPPAFIECPICGGEGEKLDD
jgi:DNA-directed RNA polymerase subunit RPC12/RpoP